MAVSSDGWSPVLKCKTRPLRVIFGLKVSITMWQCDIYTMAGATSTSCRICFIDTCANKHCSTKTEKRLQ